MEILIRHGEAGDLEAVRAIYAGPNVVAGTLQVPFPSLELWRKRLDDLEPDARVLVAVADGTVVGHLGIHPAYRPRRAHAASLGMAVHDAWAGQGIGSVLTHTPAALYEAFEPAVARRLVERLEIHHTPKQGSWLNMAEIELSVLSRQCLDRRIPDADTLTREVAAWEQARNGIARPVDWRFTTPDARIKLKRLYPSFQDG